MRSDGRKIKDEFQPARCRRQDMAEKRFGAEMRRIFVATYQWKEFRMALRHYLQVGALMGRQVHVEQIERCRAGVVSERIVDQYRPVADFICSKYEIVFFFVAHTKFGIQEAKVRDDGV